jgi:2,3-bisphosphoglycerate-dependent phosphoglycerate mutase
MCGGAIKTCDLALEAADQLHVPVTKSWRLNERMYGALTGLDKKETHGKLNEAQLSIHHLTLLVKPCKIL